MTKLNVSIVKSTEIDGLHKDPNWIELTGNDDKDALLLGRLILEGRKAISQMVDTHLIGFVIREE